ncbi:zinc-finger-containing protein [Caproicibacter sp. BJN0012]|uniref:zinc-finger-containing protein n=1 Tax=Caproicibacter sp. BJN0012 TaxID=3110227 RepID=UPI002E159F22
MKACSAVSLQTIVTIAANTQTNCNRLVLEVIILKRIQIKCPYCGAQAVLRPASVVYGKETKSKESYLYVCSRWPQCDAYVGTHRKDLSPMGTLANGDLRHKRILAHKALESLWKSSRMEKRQAYVWLQAKLGLNSQQTHIAKFSEFMCDQVIAVCSEAARSQRPAA